MMGIRDLIVNFQSALIAIVPSMEAMEIPWRRPLAYDDWDRVATSLFEALVSGVIEDRLGVRLGEEFSVCPYDLFQRDYSRFVCIEVRHPSLPAGISIFHALGTDHSPFDIVETCRITEGGNLLSEELFPCIVGDAEFFARVKIGDVWSLIDEI